MDGDEGPARFGRRTRLRHWPGATGIGPRADRPERALRRLRSGPNRRTARRNLGAFTVIQEGVIDSVFNAVKRKMRNILRKIASLYFLAERPPLLSCSSAENSEDPEIVDERLRCPNLNQAKAMLS